MQRGGLDRSSSCFLRFVGAGDNVLDETDLGDEGGGAGKVAVMARCKMTMSYRLQQSANA